MSLYTLKNNDVEVRICTYGARILSLMVPDRTGRQTDVVLGFDNECEYHKEKHLSDFGAIIGRYANRIGHAKFNIGSRKIRLPQNNFDHCLHGGPDGWQYKEYEVLSHDETNLTLALHSPDGDNGFPATIDLQVTYSIDGTSLHIDYNAIADGETALNLTNHSYFNLNGDHSTLITNHLLTIDADQFTPNDATFLPIGEFRNVKNTPMDFRRPMLIGLHIADDDLQIKNGNGYDHNWILNTRGSLRVPCASLESPITGIRMEVFTTQPGMQVYTGNFLDGSIKGKNNIPYPKQSAVCLETQNYPDSPNHSWPESSGRISPSRPFISTTIFKFSNS